MTFGFPRRPSAKGLAILALVVVVLFVLVGQLGKAGSKSGGPGSGAAAPPATGPGPTRGPQGPEQAGEWTFDEGAGRAAADTAGGNPVALLAGASWDRDGKAGTAVAFDGTRGYGETSRSVLDTSGSYSVAAWVRLDRVPAGFATAVSQDGGPDSAFALQYVPSGAWAMSGPSGRALSAYPPVRGQWTHLAGVRDGAAGTWTLYVDGARTDSTPTPSAGSGSAVSSPTSTSSGPTPAGPAGPLAIGRGRSNGTATAFFPGAVDSVRVYQGALREEDVLKLYQSGS
ncbi:MAG TPA: LamG domain-containing protein [Mycobacteriales bacterium]|nr:LamG domain-containing protein [Mycobacteriales bacterium]